MKKEEDSTAYRRLTLFNDQIYLATQFTSNDAIKYEYSLPLDVRLKILSKKNKRTNSKK